MTLFLYILPVGLVLILIISTFRWRLSKELLGRLDESAYDLYYNKTVSASAKLAAGETQGIPIKCHVLINGREMHLIPVKFHPLLFMTDFPFTILKADNKKMKVQRTEGDEITFACRKRKSSIFGSTFDVSIRASDADENRELLKKIKEWK